MSDLPLLRSCARIFCANSLAVFIILIGRVALRGMRTGLHITCEMSGMQST